MRGSREDTVRKPALQGKKRDRSPRTSPLIEASETSVLWPRQTSNLIASFFFYSAKGSHRHLHSMSRINFRKSNRPYSTSRTQPLQPLPSWTTGEHPLTVNVPITRKYDRTSRAGRRGAIHSVGEVGWETEPSEPTFLEEIGWSGNSSTRDQRPSMVPADWETWGS